MARYRIENCVVDTDNATKKWENDHYHNGSNFISKATGSQWVDQILYCSRKGRYYVETCSRVQGQCDHAEWVSPEEAARWLLLNNHELPDDLQKYSEEVCE